MYTKKIGTQKKKEKKVPGTQKFLKHPGAQRWNSTWCQGLFVCLVYKQNSHLRPVASTLQGGLTGPSAHPPMVATHWLGGAAFLFTC